jgi:formate--tetrahydrofolate ligase
VLVATVRALKYHGGVDLKAALGTRRPGALERGLANLERHVDNVRARVRLPCVVAINHFSTDTPAEVALLRDAWRAWACKVVLTTPLGRGRRVPPTGAREWWLCEQESTLRSSTRTPTRCGTSSGKSPPRSTAQRIGHRQRQGAQSN